MKLKDKVNHGYIQISLYVIITAVIIYILSLLAKNAPAIFNNLMGKVNWLLRVIRPVILGFIFAYLMDPIVNFFESKFRKLKLFKKMKRPRTWAAVLSVFIFFIAVGGLVSLLIFSVTDQLRLANFDDVIKLAEGYMRSLESFYNSILQNLEKLDIQSTQLEQYVEDTLTTILNALKGFAESIVNTITNISSYLTTIIFGFIIGFYFIIDGKMFNKYLKKICYALFSDKANRKISVIIYDLDYAFSGYVRGQLADALVMMILISLALSIVGVKFALVIGIFAGLGNLIPYFGPVVAYISTAIVCIINGDFQKLVIAVIVLFVIQFVDGNFIGPRLLSKSIKIHPLIIIVSLIFGSAIGGFLGMLLAVPIGAYLKLNFVRFVDNRILKKKEEDETAGDSGLVTVKKNN
ncbi:MAG TPA: AI-2E family transporter [Clostridiales bacterium]|jgi:predicted PurR-regulated permease PerM|nr:AI-2E family transporter [Clostridiales bacterium]